MVEVNYALLVPCYNAETYIPKFLAHIKTLSKNFDEVIFYDDGSTDNTYNLLVENDQHVIKGIGNKGPGYARNQLLEICRAKYVHFHDVDDFMHVDYLKETSGSIENGDYDVILCNVDWLKENGTLERSWHYSNTELNAEPILYTITHPIGGINGLYRKQKLIEISGYNTSYRIWEDADLHVRLAGANAKFFIIAKTLCFSIRGTDSASSNQEMGWRIRFNYLYEYSKLYRSAKQQQAIGEEAQLVASMLIMSKQIPAAVAALKLSETCGVKVPRSSNKIWQILKFILPRNLRIRIRISQLTLSFSKKIYLHLDKV